MKCPASGSAKWPAGHDAVGVLVRELEDLGYLTRQTDPLDARATLVMPTEKGHQLLV